MKATAAIAATQAATQAQFPAGASYWLFKNEPDAHIRDGVDLGSYPYSRLEATNGGTYYGVRNAQAI